MDQSPLGETIPAMSVFYVYIAFLNAGLNRDSQMSLTDFRVARCLGSLNADVIWHRLSTNTRMLKILCYKVKIIKYF